jgi:branched-chain amino acid transport system ATP-binding protein
MDYGRKIAAGKPAEVRSNPLVIKAYLGEEPDA